MIPSRGTSACRAIVRQTSRFVTSTRCISSRPRMSRSTIKTKTATQSPTVANPSESLYSWESLEDKILPESPIQSPAPQTLPAQTNLSEHINSTKLSEKSHDRSTQPPASPSPSSPSAPSNPKTREANFPFSSLSYHWDTLAPSAADLHYASQFFLKKPPAFLWSAEKFHSTPFGDSPEVCFLGRSNVGKSSLLNALLQKANLAKTSSKPGRTRLMNAFAVGGTEFNGKNRIVVLDMPGYGKGGREEWGVQILKYLEGRKQLKMAFLLIDASHGIKKSDLQILALFRQKDIPHQIVLSKVDRVLFKGSRWPSDGALEARISELRKTFEEVKEVTQPASGDESAPLGEIIAVSSEKWVNGKRLGIDAVRHAMLQAAGLQYVPRIKTKEQEIVSHDELWGPDGSPV